MSLRLLLRLPSTRSCTRHHCLATPPTRPPSAVTNHYHPCRGPWQPPNSVHFPPTCSKSSACFPFRNGSSACILQIRPSLASAAPSSNYAGFFSDRRPLHRSASTSLNNFQRTPSSRGFCSTTLPDQLEAMPSTLSQPQTPATINSPLREQRQIEVVTDRLETPTLDDRSYKVIRLPNLLEVLLVHDGDTDKSSAAMDVNVGNFSDEEEIPGMAHAVEHCEPSSVAVTKLLILTLYLVLFMGTKKVCRIKLFPRITLGAGKRNS